MKESPPPMLAGMIFLSGLCILLGVYPQLVHPMLDSAAKTILKLLTGL